MKPFASIIPSSFLSSLSSSLLSFWKDNNNNRTRQQQQQRQQQLIIVAVVAVAAVVSTTTVMMMLLSSKSSTTRRINDNDDDELDEPVPKITSSRSQLVSSDKLWETFERAAHVVRTNARKRRKRKMTNGDQLMLYGLYKQIVIGDCSTNNSSGSSLVDQAKSRAWMEFQGMDIETAIANYIQAVEYFFDLNTKATTTRTKHDDDDDDEEEEDDYDHDDTVSRRLFGPAAVSRPIDMQDEDDDPTTTTATTTPNQRLLQAASTNDIATIRELLLLQQQEHKQEKGIDNTVFNINYADSSGQTALHLAADHGYMECVRLLVECGLDANVNAVDQDGISILQAAVIAGHVNIVRYLLSLPQSPANPHLADHDGDTPISCAYDDGNPDMIQLFAKYTTTAGGSK